MLRNVARRGAATSHVFLIDVDVMPSLNIRDEFNAFAQRESLFDNDSKVVFVVPVFEIKKGLECPNNKNELVTACRDNTVRPFHNKVVLFTLPVNTGVRYKFRQFSNIS